MKKFLTVLAIALIAMTSVFASTDGTGTDDLVLTLKVESFTNVGFTSQSVSGQEGNIITPMQDQTVTSNQVLPVFASVITNYNGNLNIELTLPNALKNDKSDDTVTLEYDQDERVFKVEKTGKVVKHSTEINVTVGDTSNVVAGTYKATLKMTVSPE